MDQSTRTTLEAELAPGEQLLWAGQPRQGLLFSFHDLLLIPGGLVWLFFLLVPLIVFSSPESSSSQEVSWQFLLGYLLATSPFTLFGLYLLFGRYIVDIQQRRRTYYGLTEKRALIISGVFRRRFQSIYLPMLSKFHLKEERNERGTIYFGPIPPQFGSAGNKMWPWISKEQSSFDSIPDSRHVYNLVRDIQSKNPGDRFGQSHTQRELLDRG